MADNILVGGRRRMWRDLTPWQQRQALRLTLVAVSIAASGAVPGVVAALREAGEISPAVERHVRWAATCLASQVRLLADPDSRVADCLVAAVMVRLVEADAADGRMEVDLSAEGVEQCWECGQSFCWRRDVDVTYATEKQNVDRTRGLS